MAAVAAVIRIIPAGHRGTSGVRRRGRKWSEGFLRVGSATPAVPLGRPLEWGEKPNKRSKGLGAFLSGIEITRT